MIEKIERPGKAFTAATYSDSRTYEDEDDDELGGGYAKAGVGHARAEWSLFDAEAKGPNVGVGAIASAKSGVGAFAKAELGSASATAGPVKATVGLAVDTGASIGPSGVEAKVLGTGFSIGRKMGVSLFGNSIEFNLW